MNHTRSSLSRGWFAIIERPKRFDKNALPVWASASPPATESPRLNVRLDFPRPTAQLGSDKSFVGRVFMNLRRTWRAYMQGSPLISVGIRAYSNNTQGRCSRSPTSARLLHKEHVDFAFRLDGDCWKIELYYFARLNSLSVLMTLAEIADTWNFSHQRTYTMLLTAAVNVQKQSSKSGCFTWWLTGCELPHIPPHQCQQKSRRRAGSTRWWPRGHRTSPHPRVQEHALSVMHVSCTAAYKRRCTNPYRTDNAKSTLRLVVFQCAMKTFSKADHPYRDTPWVNGDPVFHVADDGQYVQAVSADSIALNKNLWVDRIC